MSHPSLVSLVSGLLGLAACDVVLGLGPIPDAATVDAMTCEMPSVFDAFDGDTVCGAWGYEGGLTRMMTSGDGSLTIVPNMAGGNGSCSARGPAAFGASGMFIEVREVLPQDISYMFLEVSWTAAGTSHAYAVSLQRSGLAFMDHQTDRVLSQVAFDLVQHRWWRIRPGANQLVGEASPDGRAWIQIGVTDSLAVPAAVEFELNAGNFMSSTAPGRAVFDSFNLCPPPT